MTPEQATAALVERRLLTDADRQLLLEEPSVAGGINDLPRRISAASGLDCEEIVQALAQAIVGSAPRVRLFQTPHDPAALEHVPARDAWDHLILPLAFAADGSLLCCTTRETLPASLGYLYRHLAVAFNVVLAEMTPLEMFIAERYRYEGVEVEVEAEAA